MFIFAQLIQLSDLEEHCAYEIHTSRTVQRPACLSQGEEIACSQMQSKTIMAQSRFSSKCWEMNLGSSKHSLRWGFSEHTPSVRYQRTEQTELDAACSKSHEKIGPAGHRLRERWDLHTGRKPLSIENSSIGTQGHLFILLSKAHPTCCLHLACFVPKILFWFGFEFWVLAGSFAWKCPWMPLGMKHFYWLRHMRWGSV